MMTTRTTTTTTARWGISVRISLITCAAVFLAVIVKQWYPESHDSSTEGLRTVYCYEGVFSHTSSNNCFGVSSTTGKFTSVFTSFPAGTEYEIRKGYAVPGLWDGHGHLLQYGEFLHSADLFGSDSVGEIKQRLNDYLEKNPGVGSRDNWARGIGWDQMALGGMPTAKMLEDDDRLKGRYFMLDRVDVHCTWVSQAVLDLLSDDDLPDHVPGGEIIREPGMGVFCDNAMDYVMALWPRPNVAKKKEFIRSAMKELHAVGLVGVHNAGVFPRDIALFDEMSRTDEDWTLRVYAMMECAERNTFCPGDAVRIEHPWGLLSVRSVKLFADGALGSWGSAMIEPYTDRPDMSGSLLVNASTLTSLARSWSAAGYQVNIHAIGDLANRFAIDAMQAALEDACPPQFHDNDDWTDRLRACQVTEKRFRIEHSQIIHPDDQARMHYLGIIPSIQPTHATSDMAYAERRLGAVRTKTEAYRMKSLLDLNPVLGSDFPVEPPNPFEGLYAAVTRKSPRTGLGGPSDEKRGWYAEEALSVHEAVAGFTTGAAFGGFMEGQAGVIADGAFADWIVLDEPLEKVDPEELRHVRVRETWVGGKMVYSRDDGEGNGKTGGNGEDL
ncbi:amidohydrolase family-domain-containing protein [Apodospora peruviana]|uniref:Amidohydrolase family-domain-containing protein n=1 Tax=Apodospora peruviana TaxID=516989 RepID=A0AAE0I1G6_9PEZI|nr:amidohydrolase family-domain-containing protein [Apodospora peruviana]